MRENFGLDPKEVRVQAHCGCATTFSIAPIAHLLQSLKQMSACNWHTGGHTDDATTPFGLGLKTSVRSNRFQRTPRGDQSSNKLFPIHDDLFLRDKLVNLRAL